jgi:predicted nucleotidyltransferase
MRHILAKNITEIKKLCNTHNVKRLFAFGSVMTDKFNENSDIDLLITFKPYSDPGEYADNYFDLVDKFEMLFKRNVDLVTNKSLSNPYFIKSINKTKTLLYGN